ncbi:VOC family protein [Solirubrobacter sp. CPCC 204708]|uniref:VOC family protein n=1 Tax=Solirubrobacter deserti TaxID=2282478 RepID=A0ABT4RG62_9ACTN|nr:VOC family protein [Solirubrobacter deserti]MBE2319731.1 VOC family protein [Solirubrobacter deserti]MDA0137529.1 VOC family protein [Solirubrobacter deserti]
MTPGAMRWADTMQPDLQAAAAFYGALMGWELSADGDYLIARVDGRRVAGIGQAPPGVPGAFWSTYVGVDALEPALDRLAAAGASVLVRPMQINREARAAAVADPDGVPLGLWESATGFELTREPGAWAMSALHSPDPERATRFYADAFGWEAEHTPPLVRWRLAGAEDVIAVMAPVQDGVPPHWAVNFRVEDVDAAVARAPGLGGTVLLGPLEAEGLRNAVIADPQGAVIAISAGTRPG